MLLLALILAFLTPSPGISSGGDEYTDKDVLHRKPRKHWLAEGGLVAALLLIAAAARFYRIDEIPAGLWLDETDIAKQALEIVNGARPKPWQVARLELPWLYHYYVASIYQILGTGYLTVKFPHLLISVLTVVPLYLLARDLFSPRVAVIAAFLWATMRWSVNMSRWGHANTLTLFWFCTVLWLVWRAQTTGKWRYWVLGGLALGLSQYGYQATRSLVMVVAVFLVYLALSQRDFLRRGWRPVLVFWGLFALVYAPLAWTYIHNPNLFLERSRAISIFNPLFTPDPWAALRENVGKYLGMFHYIGDRNGRHNIPGWPMLDPITGVFLVIGLGRVLRHPLRPRHVLLLLWIAAFMAAGILTTEAPNTFRVYGLTPVVAIVAALGIGGWRLEVRNWRLEIGGWRLDIARGGVAAVVAVVCGVIAYLNLHTFFAVQATHPGVVGMFNVGPTKVGQYIATLPREATIYLDREFWAFSPIEVINPGRPLTRLKTPDHVPPPQKGEVVYVLGSYGRALAPYLQRLYPNAQVDEGTGPRGVFVYEGVRLSASQTALRGLRASWWGGDAEGSPPAWEGIALPTETPIPAPARGTLRGGLFVPRAGQYQIRVDNVTEITWRVAGKVILTQPGVATTVLLPGGLVPTSIELVLKAGQKPRFTWLVPDMAEWMPIADERWYPVDVPEGGLLALWFEGGGVRTPPVRITHAAVLYADNAGNLATSAMRWLGRIRVDRAGVYTFGLSSDDGSRLWIDDQLVVDNWGLHGAGWVEGSIALEPGWHRIRIDYIDNGGSYWFEWRWARPGQSPGPVPPNVLDWTWDDLRTALTPPAQPPPVIRVVDASGQVIGTVPVAAARLNDPQFNQPVGDANFQTWPMKLGNRMYDRGIGVYGPGELEFRLEGKFRRFRGMVGIDTDSYGDRHTRVLIIGDGQVLWDSDVIGPWDEPRAFDVDVSGVNVLILRQVEEGLFEGRGDGVDWVDPTLIP